jgi:predicted dehydrogenase
MAGRSHAQAYRSAQTVFGMDAPPVRLVAFVDINPDFANHSKDRYGFERTESGPQAIVDAVSIVVTNHLHREIAKALLASGKHVLCEKPLASSVEDAEAMVKGCGSVRPGGSVRFLLSPLPRHKRHWGSDQGGGAPWDPALQWPLLVRLLGGPDAPTSWRYDGPIGSGALADIGSHLIDLSEQLCGPITKINGATLPIVRKPSS